MFVPPTVLNLDAIVRELIDEDLNWCNVHLLERIFSKEKALLIQTIPLSSINQVDTLIWRGTVNGVFSVKNAYYLQKELETRVVTECSSTRGSREIWKKLWSLPIHNTEKNFLWHHDILPTCENLHKRKIINDPVCPICGFMMEISFHILWQCPAAMDVWGMGPVEFQKCNCASPGFLQVVESKFYKCDNEEVALSTGLVR